MRDPAVKAGFLMTTAAFLLAMVPYLLAHAFLRDGRDWGLLALMIVPIWALVCAGTGAFLGLLVFANAVRLRDSRVLVSIPLAFNLAALSFLIVREII